MKELLYLQRPLLLQLLPNHHQFCLKCPSFDRSDNESKEAELDLECPESNLECLKSNSEYSKLNSTCLKSNSDRPKSNSKYPNSRNN
jgi:hypothetical protein